MSIPNFAARSTVFAGRRRRRRPAASPCLTRLAPLHGGVLIARDGAVVAETATDCGERRRPLRLARRRAVGADLAADADPLCAGRQRLSSAGVRRQLRPLAGRSFAACRRRRAICRSVALQIRDHACDRRHAPGSRARVWPCSASSRSKSSRSIAVRLFSSGCSIRCRSRVIPGSSRPTPSRCLNHCPTGSARRGTGRSGFT